MEIIIRPIQISDNPIIAKIIRTSLEDLGANLPGTVYFEESTDHLFELFNSNKNCGNKKIKPIETITVIKLKYFNPVLCVLSIVE